MNPPAEKGKKETSEVGFCLNMSLCQNIGKRTEYTATGNGTIYMDINSNTLMMNRLLLKICVKQSIRHILGFHQVILYSL